MLSRCDCCPPRHFIDRRALLRPRHPWHFWANAGRGRVVSAGDTCSCTCDHDHVQRSGHPCSSAPETAWGNPCPYVTPLSQLSSGESNVRCCHPDCTQCGGPGCGKYSPGLKRKDCCRGPIAKHGKECGEAPCVLPVPVPGEYNEGGPAPQTPTGVCVWLRGTS